MSESSRRIVILGLPASGKSTLASKLAQKLGLIHIEADRYFWKADGTEKTKEMFLEDIRKAVSENSWIFEGHFKSVKLLLDPTDVILLDFSFRVVICHWILRSARTRDWSDWPWVILKRRSLCAFYEAAIDEYERRGVRVMRVSSPQNLQELLERI